jgi:hypothetical protein
VESMPPCRGNLSRSRGAHRYDHGSKNVLPLQDIFLEKNITRFSELPTILTGYRSVVDPDHQE